MKALRQILKKIRQADTDYGMIQSNDRICVGVSGGKDSVLLLYALHLYRHIRRHYDHDDFEVIGIHLDPGFGNMDFAPVRSFASEHGMEFHEIQTDIYEALKAYPEADGRLSCSRCSQFRKGALTNAAKQYQCNKTALGHHGDDAVETLFLNMIYGSRISVFEPVSYLSVPDITQIRPMIYVREKEIIEAVRQENIPVVKNSCPNEGVTQRQRVHSLLESVYAQFPSAEKNFLSSLSNEEQLSIWKKSE